MRTAPRNAMLKSCGPTRRFSGRTDRTTSPLTGWDGFAATMTSPTSATSIRLASESATPNSTGDQVGRAEKLVDEKVRWLIIDFDRPPELMDTPVLHDCDAIGHAHGFILIVSDQDCGDPERLLKPANLDLHIEPQILIERRKWFVEEEHARLDGERSGERHALLLTTGQLTRKALAPFVEMDEADEFADSLPEDCALCAARLETVGDVLFDCHMREERVVLEHDSDAALSG